MEQHAGRMVGLWDAVKQAAPEVAIVPAHQAPQWALHPGLRHWLLVQFALNVPGLWIRDDLKEIREEQAAEGDPVWPELTRRNIEHARTEYESEWRPITDRIEQGIEQVGVLSKNRRLMALQQMYERVAEMVWSERNQKTEELYLLKELRAILHQIAEEKGELGDDGVQAVDVLGDLAKQMVEMLALRGSGMRETENAPIESYFVEPDK